MLLKKRLSNSIFISFILSSTAALATSEKTEIGEHVKLGDSTEITDNKFSVFELNGDGAICHWASKRFDARTAELEGQYQWNNVNADLLEYPKEYFGYIKHLEMDIDNDGEKEYLIKVTSYLGGTLSAKDLVIARSNFLLQPPVSVKTIFSHSSFSLKTDGKKAFTEALNTLKTSGVNTSSSPDLLYGYSIYELQHNLNNVFEYEGKNYILLNSFLNPYTEKLGLITEINKDSNGNFYNTDICFFKY